MPFYRKEYMRLSGYVHEHKMAANNTRTRTIAVMALLITGVLVIAASAVTWQNYENTYPKGTDNPLTQDAVIFVDATTGLQYFPNGITKPINTANILPKPTLIQAKTIIPIPPSASGSSISTPPSGALLTPENAYSSGFSGRVPAPVYPSNNKITKIPVSPVKTGSPKTCSDNKASDTRHTFANITPGSPCKTGSSNNYR